MCSQREEHCSYSVGKFPLSPLRVTSTLSLSVNLALYLCEQVNMKIFLVFMETQMTMSEMNSANCPWALD